MNITIEERFWRKVDQSGGPDACWLWTAYKSPPGYGQFNLAGKTTKAHRIAYELAVGPIPEGLDIDHLCNNKPCQNPAHMEPVTRAENARRRHLANPEYCAKGLHRWSDPRVLYEHHRRRECRPCAVTRTVTYHREKRAAARRTVD